ncbi:MAG: hypothetical protein WBG86_16415 [Polyangiales bacterium]
MARRTRLRLAGSVLAGLGGVFLLYVVGVFGLYAFLEYQFDRCLDGRETGTVTREAVEACLPSTGTSECNPRFASMATGDCVRYQFLGLSMADVIYGPKDWGSRAFVIYAYGSYE